MIRALAAALACSLLLAVAVPIDAAACAPAPPEGAEVQIAEEEAIIVWDPATRTETFIRRAAFLSTARSFGFLVPTPTTPQLGEVPDAVFQDLAARTRPEIRYERERRPVLGCVTLELMKGGGDKLASSAPPEEPAVRVLATARVAGFDATTLAADDAGALAGWLQAHGFSTTPALTEWLARYVAQRWQITALVVATDENDPRPRYELATRAVRMTFQTDRPFYPYREPAAAPTASAAAVAPGRRSLRVHFLSTERYAASLAGAPWPAPVVFAAPLAPSPELAMLGAQRHATVFLDEAYPRRGVDEVYFAPSPDRAEVRPPPQIIQLEDEVFIPAEPIILVLAAIVLLVLLRRRRRRRSAPRAPEA